MNGFDLSTISAAYLGSVSINEIYLGSVKIWPAGLPIGTTYNFDYTGTVQSQELPPGTYRLQCWGAQGGSSTGTYAATGSKGGYSEGILTLASTTTLYIFVGGAGETIASSSTSTTVVNGGWNGGGGAPAYTGASAQKHLPRPGGGATDIALVTSSMDYSSNRTNRSSASYLSRIIVAGGGGGSCYYRQSSVASNGSSVGGGTSGGGQNPGTQSTAGTGGGYGYGGNVANASVKAASGAGGGGWYGGGRDTSNTASSAYVNYSGGGSGFVNTSANAQYRPTGYTGLELDSGATYAGNTSFSSTSGSTETGHSGDGYARITCVDSRLIIPLTFDILGNGTIGWKASYSTVARTIQYRKNNSEWSSITSTTEGVTISVANGDVIQFRGANTEYANSVYYNCFTATCNFNVRGNIMSLFSSSDFDSLTSIPAIRALMYLFRDNTNLNDASELLLPATTLATHCYYGMFYGCTGLSVVPQLPATTLAEYCYSYMFYKCSSITSAPVIKAATIAANACVRMFQYCTNLSYVKCLATDISATNAVQFWLGSVAASGTFVKAATMNDWPTSSSGIPSGWTVQDAS